MTTTAYLFLGLTAIVAALVGLLTFAVARFIAAARATARDRRPEGAETAFMAAAVEEALTRLRQEERATKARAEATERLSDEIIASMTSGLIVVDGDGTVRTLNPAGQAMLGLKKPFAPAPMHELLRPATPLRQVLEEALRSGQAMTRRTIRLDGSGATHLGLTISPIRDEAGEAHGVIGLFSDLSEVMDLEEQLRLKEMLARLGELTAGIAHEFRNGLATIHGYSRLIALDRLPSEYQPYVQGIRDETEALGQVVTNFLNFAKPAQLTLAPVDVAALAERAADEVRADAVARGGTVTVRGQFGRVVGDEVLLRQALSNLCRNALEACVDAGVPPRIRLEGEPDPAHGQVRISVSDNGPGIAPDVAPRIFRPFFTTKDRGTGLGLALVQKIIVTHNGRVAAGNDASNGGARFLITLPATVD